MITYTKNFLNFIAGHCTQEKDLTKLADRYPTWQLLSHKVGGRWSFVCMNPKLTKEINNLVKGDLVYLSLHETGYKITAYVEGDGGQLNQSLSVLVDYFGEGFTYTRNVTPSFMIVDWSLL